MSKEENIDEYIAPDLSAYLAVITSRFLPADVGSATHWWSTSDVCVAIRSVCGETPKLRHVHDMMIEGGFSLGSPPGSVGCVFLWMLREK